jgi:protein-L-isoaspartate(D-aspartate) O-methyltransferase
MAAIDFETARRNMVEYQIRCCKVLDPVVLDTIEALPRERFVPAEVQSLAYMEGKVPLPCGQEMLSPLQEATILQALELQGKERVLEVGAGTGFMTALIATHAKEVLSFEIHQELADLASNNLDAHGIDNAKVICANAMEDGALNDVGQFDAIVLGAALDNVPDMFRQHLNPFGRLIAFLGHNPLVTLECMDSVGGAWRNTTLLDTLLNSMEGLSAKREFVF